MMTDGINAEVYLEIHGIEVDDEDISKLRSGTLTPAEINAIVYEGINGNFMELQIVRAKLTQS